MNSTAAYQHSPALLASAACGAMAYFVQRFTSGTGMEFSTTVQVENEIHNMNAGMKYGDVHIMNFLVWAQSAGQEIHIMNVFERSKAGGPNGTRTAAADRAATEGKAKELEMKS